MKFIIEPLDFWKDLSKITDDDVLKRLTCSSGAGCCDGAKNCHPEKSEEEC